MSLLGRGSHYSFGLNAKPLRNWAKRTAKVVAAESRELSKTPVFCYSGMSGVSIATALQMAMGQFKDRFVEPEMVYVRKSDEKSHGKAIENSFCDSYNFNPTLYHTSHFFIFVDDFITHGDTFARVDFALKEMISHICVSEYDESSLSTARTRANRFIKSLVSAKPTDPWESPTQLALNFPLGLKWKVWEPETL
jgi:hypothetical protein